MLEYSASWKVGPFSGERDSGSSIGFVKVRLAYQGVPFNIKRMLFVVDYLFSAILVNSNFQRQAAVNR
jgi:hypothetical protein